MIHSRVITIDCETLPANDELVQLCAPAAIDEIADDTAQTALEERCKQSALDGASGRLLCIGFIDERGTHKPLRGVCGWNHQASDFELNEATTLADFWELMRGFVNSSLPYLTSSTNLLNDTVMIRIPILPPTLAVARQPCVRCPD